MSFPAMAPAEGFEPSVAALETAGLRCLTDTGVQNIEPGRNRVRWNDVHTGPLRHDSPNDPPGHSHSAVFAYVGHRVFTLAGGRGFKPLFRDS